MAVATMSLFTNCSKDNDDNGGDDNNKPTVTDVSGTYIGTISAMGESSDVTSVLEKTDDNYSLSLTNLNIAAMGMVIEIGDVTIPNVTVSGGKLSGGDKISKEIPLPPALVAMSGMETAIVDVTLTSGEVVGNNLKFELNVYVIVMEMNVPVNFDGNSDKDDDNDDNKDKDSDGDKDGDGDKDDDDNKEPIVITDVTGSYIGTMSAMGESNNAAAELTKNNDSYLLSFTNLNIKAMGMVLEVGDVTIPNVTVSEGKLSGGDKITMEVVLPPTLAMMTQMQKANVDVSLTSGAVVGNNLKFELSVYIVVMDMNVPVNFDGNK